MNTEADRTYSALVRDHFASPRQTGELAPADNVIIGAAGNVDAGASFRFSARVESSRLAEVRVRVYGCPHCIAAASWLAEQIPAMTIEQLEGWSWRAAEETLSVPSQKRGRLLILEDAARALARAWRRDE